MGGAVLLALSVSACMSPGGKPIPDGYSGPLARVFDSLNQRGETTTDIFYVAEVNGRAIPNSLTETRANHGLGVTMSPVLVNRQVPAQPSTFKIVGRTEYAGPVLSLVGKVYAVSGETTFTPLPDHVYQVKGVLTEQGSSVWIMDTSTYQVMGQKIEVQGSSTLEFYQKYDSK
jgi:hypothetical protein